MFDHLMGWKHLPEEIERIQCKQKFYCMADIPLFAKDETVLIYKAVEQLIGKFNTRIQAIGDCVSFGAAAAVDAIKAVQIIQKNILGDWVAETATEPIYALSRVQVGRSQLSGQDGSSGAWAAEAVKTYGTLVRIKYGNYDFTNYSGDKARQWGESGLPQDLIPIAKQHLVKTVTRINSVEECKAAITNWYPVTIACNQGFQNRRDKNGFSWPQGNWAHQQVILAYRTDIRGFLIQNSWPPDWISGPKALGQPEGSYWITEEVLHDIFNSGDADMWAFSAFDGYPPQKITLRWF